MIKVGLTGSIATGKSTVVGLFKKLGAAIIDADIIAHQVVEPNQPAFNKIVEVFGQQILGDNGKINRPKLGQIVFNDSESRQTLNSIIHPEVRLEMLNQTQQLAEEENKLSKNYLVIFDIPLLFESKLAYMVDTTIVVYCPKSMQVQRIIERDQLSEEQALQRINAQISIEEKVKVADEVIDNSRDLSFTQEQVEMFMNKYDWDNIKSYEIN